MYRVQVFVDGFNLYHAIANNKNLRHFKWLDLYRLSSIFLNCKEDLKNIFFFTAFYPNKPLKRKRHEIYIKALKKNNIQIVYGQFRKKHKYCPICKNAYQGYEEKQTDVNIAIQLFRNAIEDNYDTAVIISADSDLIPAIEIVKKTFPSKQIKLLIPPNRRCEELKKVVDSYIKIRSKHLDKSQFGETLKFNNLTLKKPKEWY